MGNILSNTHDICSIPVAEYNENQKAWHEASSYADCLALSRAYLRDERRSNPLMAGSIQPETFPLVPGLLRLHDYGIMTLESQPHDDGGPIVDHDYDDWSLKWRQRVQRAWLSFLIPRTQNQLPLSNIDAFCEAILAHPRIMTRIVGVAPSSTEAPIVSQNIDSIDENGYCRISDVRMACTERELRNTAYELETVIPPWEKDCPEGRWPVDWIDGDWPAVEATRPLEIDIVARDWDDDLDLQALVEQVAIKAGLRRVYIE